MEFGNINFYSNAPNLEGIRNLVNAEYLDSDYWIETVLQAAIIRFGTSLK
jgi:hypothetical protein